MQPLRILHVVPYFEHAWAYGGIPRVVTTLAYGLARRGHAITVCTTDACDATSRARGPHTPHSGPGGVDVRRFPNLSNRLAFRWQAFVPLGLTRAVQRLLPDIDVAHLHACRNLPVASAARVLSRAGLPYVVSPHGTAPIFERRHLAKRCFDLTAGRGYLEGAARVIVVSDAERRQLQELGVSDARLSVLPNPVDETEFTPPPTGDRFRAVHRLDAGPIVLLLAKLTPRKGADVLLRAFAQLQHSTAQLVIAGSDMQSGLAPDALARVPRARHVGLLTGRDRLDALAAADVVVYPSRDEVFGLVPIEALLAGSPVIVCSDSGGGRIIGTLGGGHIVPPGDHESLRGAIESMLNAGTLWRQRARSAALRARSRFGADVVCERLDRLYRDVLGLRKRNRRSA